MGFFTKIKKFWGKGTEESAETGLPAAEPDAGETAQPAAPAAEPEPEASAAPERTVEPVAAPTPTPETEASRARAPSPAAPSVAPEPEPSHAAQPAEPSPRPQAAQPAQVPAAPELPPIQAMPEAVREEAPGRKAHGPAAAPTAPGAPAPELADWQRELILALRQAEPRLSVWLSHALSGVETAGPKLWERLAFLLKALETPETEAQDFIARFQKWLRDMEYERVEEFRSELQYRLALALDLEDEEDERNRLLLKLSEGLTKTKERISRQLDTLLSSHKMIDEAFWDEFEEILIMADVGYEPTRKLLERLRERVRRDNVSDPALFRDILQSELETLFKTPKRITAVNPPEVVLMIGVNGVGKTTTIAKLAYRAQMQGRKVLVAAGDTFRAAAIEQLGIWAGRAGVGFFAKSEGSDPAAVAFEAVDKAVAEGYDLLLVDTAGRLHTKTNLMEELLKIRRVLGKKHPGAPHRCILVVDATTGQNALSQTKLFNEGVGVDEIILTKLDGTAKGGIVVAIAVDFTLPISFVGLGEKMEDLRPFNGRDFAQALLGGED